MASSILLNPLDLPCGVKIPNRFMKAAMSEGLGTKNYWPSDKLLELYKIWGKNKIGLVITGNVMVDTQHLGEPGNVVVENEKSIDLLEQWSESVTSQGNHIWMQINHPGKQVSKIISSHTVAPSAVPLDLPGFAKPRELRSDEIKEIIERFANTAMIAKKAKFSGVQIHGAHGYLIAQFLSPHHNQRKDEWGGSFENRMRFLVKIYQKMREKVGTDFPIGIKINSTDFQRGGFSMEESLSAIKILSQLGIDLIEVSGGNYESPAMMGKSSQLNSREGYFRDFACLVKKNVEVPVALTGGLRQLSVMEMLIEEKEADIVGLARPFAIYPDLIDKLLYEKDFKLNFPVKRSTGFKLLDKLLMTDLTWYSQQIHHLANRKKINPNLSPIWAAMQTLLFGSWKNMVRKRS